MSELSSKSTGFNRSRSKKGGRMKINMIGNRLDTDMFMIMSNGTIVTGIYDEFNRFIVHDMVPGMHVRALNGGSFAVVYTPANEPSSSTVFGNIREVMNHLHDHYYWLDEACGWSNMKFVVRDLSAEDFITFERSPEVDAFFGIASDE